MPNKVRFGLKIVHYATVTFASDKGEAPEAQDLPVVLLRLLGDVPLPLGVVPVLDLHDGGGEVVGQLDGGVVVLL